MRVKTFKRVSAALLTLVLMAGLMPAAAFAADAVENTAPAVEYLATVDELWTEFDMDDSTDKTFKQVYFGNKAWQWSIAGVDPAGGGLVLLFGNSPVHRSYFSAALTSKTMILPGGLSMRVGLYLRKFLPTITAPAICVQFFKVIQNQVTAPVFLRTLNWV